MNYLLVKLRSSTILLWLSIPTLVAIGYFKFTNTYIELPTYNFLLIFIAYILFVFSLKSYLAYRYFSNCHSYSINNKNIEGNSPFLLLTTLSPDFILTTMVKEEYTPFKPLSLKSEKLEIINLKRKLLKLYNYSNILLSTILVLLTTLWIFHSKLFITLLIFRTISRSLEIIFSFSLDVMEKQKTSNLQPSERLKLAIISYIELIILYTGIYAMVGYMPIEKTLDVQTLIDNLFISVGNMTFTDVNFSYYYTGEILKSLSKVKYFFLLQVITGIVLIIFAIASYIGDLKKAKQ